MTTSVTACVITPFLFFHGWLLSQNKTTIEFCELGTVVEEGENGEVGKAKHPYDLGLWHNIKTALGEEWYFWLLPVKPTICDGLDWKVAPEFEDKKKLPPALISTVTTALNLEALHRHDLTRVPSDEEEPEPEAMASVAPRRKCWAARGVSGATFARLPEEISAMSARGKEAFDRLRQHPSAPPMPRFIKGGVRAMQECSEDFFAYSRDTTSRLLSWNTASADAPAPRVVSTVTSRRFIS